MRESKIYLYIKIMINLLFVILSVLFIIFILPKILRFFMPFVIGWIVAMIANPLVMFLEKRAKLLRKHSSAIIIVVVLAAIVGATYLLILLLFEETKSLINNWDSILNSLELQFNAGTKRLSTISESLPHNIQTVIENFTANVGVYISNFMSEMEPPTISSAGTVAKNIAEGFLMIIITILSAYFFIARREEIIVGMKKVMPEAAINSWHLIVANFRTAVGGYFKAQFKIMLIIATVMFIGFEVIQVDYSSLLALGISFLDFLPFFGTGAVLWPWALFDMMAGNYMRAIALVVIYIICQVIKQILQPKLVGDSIGISPLTTLVFMFIGYRFYGVLGMIIGIPIGMVLVNFYRIGMFDRVLRGIKIIVHDINVFRKY